MSDNKTVHVFLSHNSIDKPQVEQMAHRLRAAGIKVWLDKWNLIPGDPWQEGIEEALDECDCCLVFVGKEGIGPWQNAEMRAAIDDQVSDRRMRVIPVLLPDAERGDPSKLPTFLRRNTWVEFRYALDEPETFTRLVAGIKQEKPPIEGKLVNSENPYRGLQVFDIEHSRFFFGRSVVVDWLLDEIRPSESRDSRARFKDNRFLAIIGASGSGKSSVARAGLMAALKNGQLPGSENWPQVIVKPGEKPLQSLALSIISHPDLPSYCRIDLPALVAKFDEQPLQLHYLALEWLKGNEQQRLVILADQFEEVFTLCQDDAERRAFLDNLLSAAHESTGQVIVVLTLRADFYPNLTPYEQLSRDVESHQYLLNPLSEAELREAVVMPAQLSGAEMETLLVDDLVKDTLEQPGSLPLLQFALSRLWEQCSGRVLRLKEYRELGGLTGALEQRANGIYGNLSSEDQEQCRLVFRRLVQPGEGTTDTRRRARLDEFSEDQQRIVRLMADERLLTTQREEGDAFVEVAHEALIGGWSRLKSWVNDDRVSIQTQHLVSSAANEWESKGKKVGGLLPEARLLDAEKWVGDYPEQATDLEQAFVTSEGRVVRRQRNRVKWFAGVMAVVAVGMVVLAWLLLERSNELVLETQRANRAQEQTALVLAKEEVARKETVLALEKEEIARKEAERSAKIAEEQTKNAKSSEQRALLAKAEVESREREVKYALSREFFEKSKRALGFGENAQENKNYLVSRNEYKKAWIYALRAIVLSDPLGRISEEKDYIAKVFDIPDRSLSPLLFFKYLDKNKKYYELKKVDNFIFLCAEGFFEKRNFNSLELVDKQDFDCNKKRLSFSDDGRSYVIESDEKFFLYDALSGSLNKVFETSTESNENYPVHINHMELNNDLVLFVEAHGRRYVWDAGQGIDIFSSHSFSDFPGEFADQISLSPYGEDTAYSFSSGGSFGEHFVIIKLKNADSSHSYLQFNKHKANISSIAFSPNGEYLASAGKDYKLYLIDLKDKGDSEEVSFREMDTKIIGGPSSDIKFSDDGILIAALNKENNELYIWDSTTGVITNSFVFTKEIGDVFFIKGTRKLLISFLKEKVLIGFAIIEGVGFIEKNIHFKENIIEEINYKTEQEITEYMFGFEMTNIISMRGAPGYEEEEIERQNRNIASGLELYNNFDPKEILAALEFIWGVETNEPVMNFNSIPSSEISKYQELLDMPKPGETKLQQLVRWLEDQKAYRKTPAGVPQ